jgi:hypothetical protein
MLLLYCNTCDANFVIVERGWSAAETQWPSKLPVESKRSWVASACHWSDVIPTSGRRRIRISSDGRSLEELRPSNSTVTQRIWTVERHVWIGSCSNHWRGRCQACLDTHVMRQVNYSFCYNMLYECSTKVLNNQLFQYRISSLHSSTHQIFYITHHFGSSALFAEQVKPG